MLSRLKSWFLARRMIGRGFFAYYDGEKTVWGDPLRIWRALQNDPEIELATALIGAGEAREPDTTRTIEAICRAFGVKRFDPETGKGLSDHEVIAQLFALTAWVDAQKKNGNLGPISLPPTDGASSNAPEPPTWTDPQPSDSGEISNDPSIDRLTVPFQA